MPIYTYICGGCSETLDYLVPRVGQVPDECRACHGTDLTRSYDGQTFGMAVAGAVVSQEGQVSNLGNSVSEKAATSGVEAKLTPGIHLTQGVTPDGKASINVSRVTKEGKVDASVTGTKPL